MECPESTHLHLYAFDMMVVTKSPRFDLFEPNSRLPRRYDTGDVRYDGHDSVTPIKTAETEILHSSPRGVKIPGGLFPRGESPRPSPLSRGL
jgi:hypothetical protein